MLVSQLDLEMQDLFAVADKAEMPGFNNPGMNGSNTHLMQFLAFDLVKRIVPR